MLTEAAIMGERDGLRGLKENVIVGRLIPAERPRVSHDPQGAGGGAGFGGAPGERAGSRAAGRDHRRRGVATKPVLR